MVRVYHKGVFLLNKVSLDSPRTGTWSLTTERIVIAGVLAAITIVLGLVPGIWLHSSSYDIGARDHRACANHSRRRAGRASRGYNIRLDIWHHELHPGHDATL